MERELSRETAVESLSKAWETADKIFELAGLPPVRSFHFDSRPHQNPELLVFTARSQVDARAMWNLLHYVLHGAKHRFFDYDRIRIFTEFNPEKDVIALYDKPSATIPFLTLGAKTKDEAEIRVNIATTIALRTPVPGEPWTSVDLALIDHGKPNIYPLETALANLVAKLNREGVRTNKKFGTRWEVQDDAIYLVSEQPFTDTEYIKTRWILIGANKIGLHPVLTAMMASEEVAWRDKRAWNSGFEKDFLQFMAEIFIQSIAMIKS